MKKYSTTIIILIAINLIMMFNLAFKPLINLQSKNITCTSASAVQITGASGFSSLICANTSAANTVYFGGSDVSSTNGYPVGNCANCASDYISLDTHQGQLYCRGSADQEIRCIVGE